MKTRFAHTNGQNQSDWQTIYDHLFNTSQLTLALGKDTGIADFAYLAALLHDIGKYSVAFQKKLLGEKNKVDHSTAGAQEVKKLLNQNRSQSLIGTILAYCIAGHHGGLMDYGSETDTVDDATLQARLKRDVEDYSEYELEINVSKLQVPDRLPIKPISQYPEFSIAFFTRMVYSILVDADFLETETFMNGGKKPRGGYADINSLRDQYTRFLEQFENPDNPINRQRTQTLQDCINKSKEKPGFFTLTVPTGGGKTYSSMAFALNHAVSNGLKRIIYVIPFTTIIDQNASLFKKCLGEENVLEHHSNFDFDPKTRSSKVEYYDEQTDNILNKIKLAAENWDIPVVVTTNVQFFESLYASRSSRCRKLHHIAQSVIIFDEAQMLPREYLKPCLFAVYELVRNYGASAVFCTATQPSIGQFLPEGTQVQEITSNPKALYNFYKRVNVIHIGRLPDTELAQKINKHRQVLCIVNTRKHAKGLLNLIVDEGRYHLSTLMCPAHRKETISVIRKRLKDGQDCRVISTQIMEAGIDVDFPVGYRSISGLDSIIQASGRVNREGREKSTPLYVFEPDTAFIKRTPAYIQQGADVAKNILQKYVHDPVSIEAIQSYFDLLYDIQDEHAFDTKGIIDCFNKHIPDELNFDFRTAAEKFRLIEDNTISVIIPYDEIALATLEEVHLSKFPQSYARRLQIYTVNIYEHEFQALQAKGLIDMYNETFYVLNEMEAYHPETGLILPETTGGDVIFFD